MKDNFIKEAVEILGKDKALVIAMEELAELQQAVSKAIRGKTNLTNLAEEMADVLICLGFIQEATDVNMDIVNEWYDFKVERIKKRIKDGDLS